MKKIFKEPSIKVIKLDYLAILTGSNDEYSIQALEEDDGEGYAS